MLLKIVPYTIILILCQIDIHKKFGGVVPEIASREHVGKITVVFEEAFQKANVNPKDIDLVAVTHHPGLIGSLIVGINAARAFAMANEIEYLEVNHIHGHIYANYIENDFSFPILALVVSGGHTELILMKNHYEFTILGQTLDDAVGETYDKVGRVMGLDYPAGPIVDKLALEGETTYKLPFIYLDKRDYNFSFSGLKSAVINLINSANMKSDEINIPNLCASFQNAALKVLVDKTIRAAQEYNVKQIVVAGGVAANKGLRKALHEEVQNIDGVLLSFPSMKYCTDNAAMIAAAGYFKFKSNTI